MLIFQRLRLPVCLLYCLPLAIGLVAHTVRGQEVKIWEFSPYEVEIWQVMDANVTISEAGQQEFQRQLKQELERTFRAAWRLQVSELSPRWTATVVEQFDSFQLADLARNELVLVASTKHPETRNVRTVDAAIQRLPSISLSAAAWQALQQTTAGHSFEEGSEEARFLEMCTVDPDGEQAIRDKLISGEIACALIPRREVSQFNGEVRSLISMLPWQTDAVLRNKDKVIFLAIGKAGADYTFRARELDCPMQYLGPAFESKTFSWPHAARAAATVCVQAFAPIARVEEAESTSAQLRHRAGGLIVEESNPAALNVGDVMQPIVRRDDRNGVPTLLQPLSWTFAAITHVSDDNVKLDANVYTYSGGPGLQGRRNRRTRRVLLRVRPVVAETSMRVVVRGTDTPQSGCFVYFKDLLTDEFELLGRTDWRGQFKFDVPDDSGRFLPDEVRRARLLAKRKALEAAAKAAATQQSDAADGEATEDSSPETSAEIADETFDFENYDPATDPEALPLHFPLRQIYLKNGNSILAKLPFVPGLRSLEIAQLPDDSRRLQAEGFVRGFQGQILDLIGLRNLHAARIQILIKDKKADEAADVLAEMRRLPTYNEMADELDRIQRQMLDEQDGAISLGAKNRIDRMFQTTRDMLQKYLQDNLLRDSEQAVRRAGGTVGSNASEPVATS